jgi:hypothetical protein
VWAHPAPTMSEILSSYAFAFTLACAVAAVAQDEPQRFVTTKATARMAIDDVPALLAALPGTKLGRLVAEPELAEAIVLGLRNYRERLAHTRGLAAAVRALEPHAVPLRTAVDEALAEVSWQDVHSVEFAGAPIPGDEYGRMQSTLLVQPRAEAEAGLEAAWQRLLTPLPARPRVTLAADQNVGGRPGLVFALAASPESAWDDPTGGWFVRSPGQFAGGFGSWRASGELRAAATPPPGCRLELDVGAMVREAWSRGANPDDAQDAAAVLQTLFGIDRLGLVRWQLGFAGEDVRDTLSLQVRGEPQGLLAALVAGMAPLPAQPLPPGALAQVRFALDVPILLATVDAALRQLGRPTLAELDLTDDLRRAWSGGVALGVGKPGPGFLAPRLFATFGIVDHAAADRLLARLRAMHAGAWKDQALDGLACQLWRLTGPAAAIQLAFARHGDALHVTDSAGSMRALARMFGGPPVMDVGGCKPPAGPGRPIANLELRYDAAALYGVADRVWLTLLRSTLGVHISFGEDGPERVLPLLAAFDLPEAATVQAFLTPGRALLRRDDDGLTLTMAGAVGGPLPALLLATWPGALCMPWLQERRIADELLVSALAQARLRAVQVALSRFEARVGRSPNDLGELLAGGDLADASLLVAPRGEPTEPVVQDGKELGRSSYRYYPTGLTVDRHGDVCQARLVALRRTSWQRLMLATDGTVRGMWDEFASIDEFERQARESSK